MFEPNCPKEPRSLKLKFFRLFWFGKRELGFIVRRSFFFATRGAHFRSLGKRVKFFGWPTFGTLEGNIDVGDDCMIGRQVFLGAGRGAALTIGDHASLNTGCHLIAIQSIAIGDGTRIGEYVTIRDQNHERDDDGALVEGSFTSLPISIGKNCWIGRGAFIAAGVTIGDDALVAANAAVTRDVPAGSVVGGVPARVIHHPDSHPFKSTEDSSSKDTS